VAQSKGTGCSVPGLAGGAGRLQGSVPRTGGAPRTGPTRAMHHAPKHSTGVATKAGTVFRFKSSYLFQKVSNFVEES